MSFILYIMAKYTMQPHILCVRKEAQKPAACVFVMHALVLSVFLMGVMLKGLAASAAKHAAQTASLSVCLSFLSLRHTHTLSWANLLTYFICMRTHPEHIPSDNQVTVIYYFWTAGQVSAKANMSNPR